MCDRRVHALLLRLWLYLLLVDIHNATHLQPPHQQALFNGPGIFKQGKRELIVGAENTYRDTVR